MREIQRHFRRIACLLLCMFLLCGTQVQAKGEVVIRIGETKGKKGEKIEIPIEIKNGTEVGGMDMTVVYDSEELRYLDGRTGSVAKDGNIYDIHHQEEKSSVRFVYASLEPLKKDGEIMLLTFQVLNDGSKKHTVDVDVKKILDTDIQTLSWKVEGGREIAPTEKNPIEKNPIEENPIGKKPAEKDSAGEKQIGEAPTGEKQIEEIPTGDTPEKSNRKTEEEPNPVRKRKIVKKTKSGAEDVTDTIGKETNENLLPEKAEEKNKYIVPSLSVAALLAAGIYFWGRRKKGMKE